VFVVDIVNVYCRAEQCGFSCRELYFRKNYKIVFHIIAAYCLLLQTLLAIALLTLQVVEVKQLQIVG
jgi:hypothetical protein